MVNKARREHRLETVLQKRPVSSWVIGMRQPSSASLMVTEPTFKVHLPSPPAAHPRSAASVSRRMLLVLLSRTTLLTSLP